MLMSSQTPSSSPLDGKHRNFGSQATYVAAMPMVCNVNNGGTDALREVYDRTNVTC